MSSKEWLNHMLLKETGIFLSEEQSEDEEQSSVSCSLGTSKTLIKKHTSTLIPSASTLELSGLFDHNLSSLAWHARTAAVLLFFENSSLSPWLCGAIKDGNIHTVSFFWVFFFRSKVSIYIIKQISALWGHFRSHVGFWQMWWNSLLSEVEKERRNSLMEFINTSGLISQQAHQKPPDHLKVFPGSGVKKEAGCRGLKMATKNERKTKAYCNQPRSLACVYYF